MRPTRFLLLVLLAAFAPLAAGCAPGGLPGSGASAITNAKTPDALVRAYYAAIEAGDYKAAYAAWGSDGAASGQSFEEFKDGFAETAHTVVEVVGPVETGAAAGSIYATVPVVVRADRKDGRRQNYTGSYVVRRANDVPGATPAQLRWHIDSADVREIR
jgi:hypothetical protein